MWHDDYAGLMNLLCLLIVYAIKSVICLQYIIPLLLEKYDNLVWFSIPCGNFGEHEMYAVNHSGFVFLVPYLQHFRDLRFILLVLCRCLFAFSWHVKRMAVRTRANNTSTTKSQLCRNAEPSAFQWQESMLKVTKYDVDILWLTVSVYKPFGRLSYVL